MILGKGGAGTPGKTPHIHSLCQAAAVVPLSNPTAALSLSERVKAVKSFKTLVTSTLQSQAGVAPKNLKSTASSSLTNTMLCVSKPPEPQRSSWYQ